MRGKHRNNRHEWPRQPNGTERTLDETADRASGPEKWLMPAEAAALFHASTRALRKWAKAGLLHADRTPGGHRRYKESEVLALVRKLAEVAA